MASNRLLFIGGLHRSGTSLLHRCLSQHPDVSAFDNTGVPEDEGQHLQSVFPPARDLGGPGRFGFNPNSHMDEHSPLVSPANREQLMAEWGLRWDRTKPVLLEKSPPTLVRTRFLQALFPDARFIIMVRHPIPVSLATQKWSKTPIGSLIGHWVVCHRRFLRDYPRLERCLVVRYEDLVSRPAETLSQVLDFVELHGSLSSATISSTINADYFQRWPRAFGRGRLRPLIARTALYLRYEPAVRVFGYSLSAPDAGPCRFGDRRRDRR